ncbi:MAG TPA: hypothetical protein VFD70_03375 [Anaerolineae bacterium]|nr:hypothetical protein [Anaerolineae bacterium]
MQPKDFSKRQKFPGDSGNNFDFMLSFTAFLARLPSPAFAIILASAVSGSPAVDPYDVVSQISDGLDNIH